MRVLHVAAYFAPAYVYGGPPRSIHALCRALVRGGIDVQVFTTDANGDERLPASVTDQPTFGGVPVRYFPRSAPRWPIGSARLVNALRAAIGGYDALHVHGLWNRVVWAAAREALRAGVPYVLSPRGMLAPAARAHGKWRKRASWMLADRHVVAGASLLHATSERERETLAALRTRPWGVGGGPSAVSARGEYTHFAHMKEGRACAAEAEGTCAHPVEAERRRACPAEAERRRIVCIPNGIDLESLQRCPDHERPLVLFVGRVHPIKRLDLLVRAFAIVRDRNPRARLAIAGPDESGLVRGLRGLAGRHAEAVEWAGSVDAGQRSALLAEAAVLVMCSDAESFGMSVLEALAAAVPVVVTRTCPWAHVEQHGAGLWVEQDAAAMAAAIGRVFEDPAAAREMGERGRRLAESAYGWSAIAGAFASEYERLASGRLSQGDLGDRGDVLASVISSTSL